PLGAADRVFAQQRFQRPERRRVAAHRLHPGRRRGDRCRPVEATRQRLQQAIDDRRFGAVGRRQTGVHRGLSSGRIRVSIVRCTLLWVRRLPNGARPPRCGRPVETFMKKPSPFYKSRAAKIYWLSALFVLAAATACGGGGGDDAAPAPAPTPAPAPGPAPAPAPGMPAIVDGGPITATSQIGTNV